MKDSLHSACTAYFRLRQIEETRIQSLGWEDPPEKEMQLTSVFLGFPGGTSSKESACQCRRLRDRGSIPGSGRSPGGGHGNPLQYSCQDNPMDRGAWWTTVHGGAKSDMTEWHIPIRNIQLAHSFPAYARTTEFCLQAVASRKTNFG